MNQILEDINTLQQEGFDHKKGGIAMCNHIEVYRKPMK